MILKKLITFFKVKEKPEIDIVFRIKDGGLLLDEDNMKIRILFESFYWLGLFPMMISEEVDIVVGFQKRKSELQVFHEENIGHAIEIVKRYAHLIDPEANIVVDTPDKDCFHEIKQIEKGPFKIDFYKKDYEDKRSDSIPEEIMGRVDEFIDFVMEPTDFSLGICHWVWGLKKNILYHIFNLRWRTPAERFPNVHFD